MPGGILRGETFKNAIALFFAKLVTPIIYSVVLLYLARIHGEQGVGEYGLVLSILIIFQAIASLGLSSLIIRETARDPGSEKGYFFSSLRILLPSAIFFYIIVFIFSLFFSKSAAVAVDLRIAGLSLFPYAFYMSAESIFITYRKSQFVTFISTFEVIVRTGLSVVFLFEGLPVSYLFLAILISASLASALSVVLLYTGTQFAGSARKDGIWPRLIAETPVFFLVSIVSVVFLRVDTIFVANMRGLAETGIFTAAYRFVEVGIMLLVSIGTALFPRVSQNAEKSPEQAGRLAHRNLNAMLIICLPMASILYLESSFLMSIFFPAGFAGGSLALQILALSLIPTGISVILTQFLIAHRRQWFDALAIIIGLTINIFLDFFLIGSYGYVGAAAASLISMSVITFIHWLATSKLLFKLNFLAIASRPLLATVIMGAVLGLFNQTGNHLRLSVAFIAYAAFITVFGNLGREALYFREARDAE